jgi:hypothetical protein
MREAVLYDTIWLKVLRGSVLLVNLIRIFSDGYKPLIRISLSTFSILRSMATTLENRAKTINPTKRCFLLNISLI